VVTCHRRTQCRTNTVRYTGRIRTAHILLPFKELHNIVIDDVLRRMASSGMLRHVALTFSVMFIFGIHQHNLCIDIVTA
jgi:hypothetical protein